MHKHQTPGANEPITPAPTVAEKLGVAAPSAGPIAAPASEASLRELLEKNLKWSQIIYEQNRRINRRLFWFTVAGWIKFFIIAIPIALAIWLLPPFIQGLEKTYGGFLKDAQTGRLSPDSLERVLELLPINGIGRDQLKNLVK